MRTGAVILTTEFWRFRSSNNVWLSNLARCTCVSRLPNDEQYNAKWEQEFGFKYKPRGFDLSVSRKYTAQNVCCVLEWKNQGISITLNGAPGTIIPS